MAAIGALGFALMFNIHGQRVALSAAGGALTWGAYLIAFKISDNTATACLVATMFTMVMAEIMARLTKTPVVMLLVPMLVPMVPGGDLFYMMSNLVLRDMEKAAEYGRLLISKLGAIVFGIIVVSTLIQITLRIMLYIAANRRRSDYKH